MNDSFTIVEGCLYLFTVVYVCKCLSDAEFKENGMKVRIAEKSPNKQNVSLPFPALPLRVVPLCHYGSP